MTRPLVVKATCGADAPERCSQALTVAATAAVSGVPVSLWLSGEAAWLGVPGRAEQLGVALAEPAEQLLELVAESGSVTVCSQCAARRGIGVADLLPGTRIAGAAAFVAEATAEGAQVLVY